jgi:hypothetical protein
MSAINYKHHKIEIFQDQDYQSPDEWGNDDCFLVYGHRDFNVKVKPIKGVNFDPATINEHVNEIKRAYYAGYYVFPVYAYIHSGVSLSMGNNSYPFNDRWDVSMMGFALVKRLKGWSYARKKAEKIAQSVVNEWNDCLSGNVWGYSITFNEELVDSLSGYYGDPKGIELDAKSVIDSIVAANPEKFAQQLELELEIEV